MRTLECKICGKETEHNDKLGALMSGNSVCSVCNTQNPISKMNWKLVRERDGLTKESNDFIWIEWNRDGTFKEKFKEIAIDRSLLMSPFNRSFTWQTTNVTEIVEQRDDYIKFKTENSTYELFKIKRGE